MISYLLFFTLSIILFLSSLALFVFALCPRFKGENKKEKEMVKKYNLLFFEDIKTF